MNILHIDSSERGADSVSRKLTAALVEKLAGGGSVTVTRRDLAGFSERIDGAWIGANYTPADQRSDAQKAALALSDTLVGEVKAADVLVIGVPVYNFSVPVTLKSWVDLMSRVGETFRYTEAGPEGLVTGKKAYLIMASGGTGAGSVADFASTYLTFVLGFWGITDVEVIAAEKVNVDAEAALKAANDGIAAIAPLAA